MRILKDKMLDRTKVYNIPQLFDFLITRLTAYYGARLTDVAIGQWEGVQKSRYLVKDSNVKPEDIRKRMTSHVNFCKPSKNVRTQTGHRQPKHRHLAS
ncbi:hypothetical protein AAFF_G00419830 [Aldrovandia affinis]|uniref:Uncharacterized protein n=1 Tax=Aldrovandia affinis TaxID=143900 RepID=A0AAD7WJ03_9TELE|nr:hypothetical protein AAFF_G00419830 [Aldrovandia affinis]